MDNNAEEQYLRWVNTISKKEELEKEIEAIIDRENSDDTINKIIDSLLEEITIIDEIMMTSSISYNYSSTLFLFQET